MNEMSGLYVNGRLTKHGTPQDLILHTSFIRRFGLHSTIIYLNNCGDCSLDKKQADDGSRIYDKTTAP